MGMLSPTYHIGTLYYSRAFYCVRLTCSTSVDLLLYRICVWICKQILAIPLHCVAREKKRHRSCTGRIHVRIIHACSLWSDTVLSCLLKILYARHDCRCLITVIVFVLQVWMYTVICYSIWSNIPLVICANIPILHTTGPALHNYISQVLPCYVPVFSPKFLPPIFSPLWATCIGNA